MIDTLIGRELPDIGLHATMDETVNLRRLRGTSVVFVYPWTGRPGHPNPPDWDTIPGAHGSTPQAQGYAHLHGAFVKLRVRIFGLSLQDNAWQCELARRASLPYPLLSDAARDFSGPLALPSFRTGGADYLCRLTMILSDGRITAVRYPISSPDRDAEETLASM